MDSALTHLFAQAHHSACRVAMPTAAITILLEGPLVGATTVHVRNTAISMSSRTAQCISSSNGYFFQSHWQH